MTAPAKDHGYDYPLGRAELRVPLVGTADEPSYVAARRQALGKLLRWGDRDIAVILGLLPEGDTR